MAGSGHEDEFPLRRMTARSLIRRLTGAAIQGNERDAPITATQYTDTPRDYGGSESTLSVLLS
jgi:hypothetical protein